jgi:hypothetical protein
MAIQAVLAITVVLAASSIGLRHWWRSERTERSALDLYPAVVGFVSILIMADSGTGSIWHRGLVLAAPSIVGFHRLPLWVLALLAVAMALVTALISGYFFKNKLG